MSCLMDTPNEASCGMVKLLIAGYTACSVTGALVRCIIYFQMVGYTVSDVKF